MTAHSGMECGALHSPKIEAFGPRGLGGTGFDPRFICPALDVEDE